MLKDFLTSNGITMQAFGDSVGVSHAQISRLCTGQSKPSPELARKIEAASSGAIPFDSWWPKETAA